MSSKAMIRYTRNASITYMLFHFAPRNLLGLVPDQLHRSTERRARIASLAHVFDTSSSLIVMKKDGCFCFVNERCCGDVASHDLRDTGLTRYNNSSPPRATPSVLIICPQYRPFFYPALMRYGSWNCAS